MHLTPHQANAISSAVFLIGLAALFYTGAWWPGILFLIGAEAVVQGFVRGRGWYALQSSYWLFAIGILAIYHFSVPLLFVFLGLSVLLNAFVRPPHLHPKPRTDQTLE